MDESCLSGSTMEERAESLLDTGLGSDCTFVVGNEKNKVQIKASKAFLIRASPVFERMFNGQLQETGTIEVPDIEPDVFNVMLRFIYGCKWEFECNLQAMGLCYAANKYMIVELLTRCEEYLWPSSVDSVWTAIEVANLYSLPKLREAAIQLIDHDTVTGYCNVLETADIVNISQNSLLEVIKGGYSLKVYREIQLFRMLVRWATAKCEEKGLPVDGQHLRNELGDILYYIRFLTMNAEDFALEVVKTGILTAEESLGVLCYLVTCGQTSPPSMLSSWRTTRYEE